MLTAFLGLYTYFEFFLMGVFFVPVLACVRLLHGRDPTRRVRGRWVRNFGKLTSALTPLWRFTIEGPAPSDIGGRGYVVVANHESSADPFLLSWLPWDMRWVSKQELFDAPLLGWLMRFGGDIPLRRGNRESVDTMLAECERTLNDGLSVMFFPEGTRSPDGRLGQFKRGAFELAIRTGRPLLPVVVAGTRRCRPKGSLWFGQARAIARILEPIEPGDASAEELAERVRGEIARERALLETRLAEGRYRRLAGVFRASRN